MNLKYFRKREGLTLKQLAQKTGISKSAIEKYERGALKLENAYYRHVLALEDALHCRAKDLMEELDGTR